MARVEFGAAENGAPPISSFLLNKESLKGEAENNGIEPDRMEFYNKRTHFSTDKGWSSPKAENTYKQMEHLKDMYYGSEESPMTIDEIVDAVLGKKSGYVKGLGYGPKPKTTGATQKRATKLEDTLRRAKEEFASIQNDLQRGWMRPKQRWQDKMLMRQAKILK